MRMIKAGTADQSTRVRFIDSVTGLAENAVNAATAGLSVWYWRPGIAKTAISVVDFGSPAALTDAHLDGGLQLIGDGDYRLDLPDAAVNTVAPVFIGGIATDMIMLAEPIQCVAFNPGDAAALGLTNLGSSFLEARSLAGGLVALQTSLTEAYRTHGASPDVPGSAAEMLNEILAVLTRWSKSGVTLTAKKLDGTTAATYTVDDANQPTSITRAT